MCGEKCEWLPFMFRAKTALLPSIHGPMSTNFLRTWSNSDFAPHMEGSHADFALQKELRNVIRELVIIKIAILANLKKNC